MKALHILYSGLGGSSSVVFSLLNENKNNFFMKQDVLFTGNNLGKDYIKKVKESKNKHFFIKTKKHLSWLTWYAVFLKLCKEKPDLIFLHNYQFLPCFFYKIFFKTKVIYIDHQASNTRIVASSIALLFSILCFEETISVNMNTAKLYNKKLNILKPKVKFIPNSVNTNFFKLDKKTKPNNHFRIGMASRIDSSKKQELIIKALMSNNLKYLNITLTLAGEGSSLVKLKNFVKSKNLQNKVKFEGFLNEHKLKSWYNKLNLYVQATVGEGMSISIFEAMSMEVPVLGSNVNGVKNILGKKKYVGILFNNTIQDLSKKIEYFYTLSDKKKNLYQKNQRKFVINNYSSSLMFSNYKKIILKHIL